MKSKKHIFVTLNLSLIVFAVFLYLFYSFKNIRESNCINNLTLTEIKEHLLTKRNINIDEEGILIDSLKININNQCYYFDLAVNAWQQKGSLPYDIRGKALTAPVNYENFVIINTNINAVFLSGHLIDDKLIYTDELIEIIKNTKKKDENKYTFYFKITWEFLHKNNQNVIKNIIKEANRRNLRIVFEYKNEYYDKYYSDYMRIE